MTNAKIDNNNEAVGLTWDESTVQPLKVDTSTNRLLIEVNPVSSTVPVLNDTDIDDNNESSATVVDDNGALRTLLIDNRNGYLWVDIVEE